MVACQNWEATGYQVGAMWAPSGCKLARYTTNWVKSGRGHIKSKFNCYITCVLISKFLIIGLLAHRGEVHDRTSVTLYTISYTYLN